MLAFALLGGALRLAAAGGDLWLDEIWSLELARRLPSIGAVFTRIHLDNNHHLNTLFLRFVGADAPPLTCRLLSVAAGAATVVVIGLRPLRGGRLEAATSLALVSLSYILVQYSSEARGYALAVLFAVAGLHAMSRYLETRRWRWALLFGTVATLGILSHLTFLYAFLAFVAWGAVELFRARRSARLDATVLACYGPPLLVLAVLWVVDLRHLVVGGGPEYQLWDVLRELVRAMLGLPRGPLELLGLAAILAAAHEISCMIRERRSEWVFFVTVLAIAPTLVLAWKPPEFLASRYFLVGVPFLLLLLGLSLARCFRRGWLGKAVYALSLVAFCVGSSAGIARLIQQGRGHYREAIETMLREQPGEIVTVGSDHDWRNAVVLGYHARRVPGAERLVYVTADRWSDSRPFWFLRHDFSDDPRPDPRLTGPNGRSYVLVRHFPYFGLSGWHWFLYRTADAVPGSPGSSSNGGPLQ